MPLDRNPPTLPTNGRRARAAPAPEPEPEPEPEPDLSMQQSHEEVADSRERAYEREYTRELTRRRGDEPGTAALPPAQQTQRHSSGTPSGVLGLYADSDSADEAEAEAADDAEHRGSSSPSPSPTPTEPDEAVVEAEAEAEAARVAAHRDSGRASRRNAVVHERRLKGLDPQREWTVSAPAMYTFRTLDGSSLTDCLCLKDPIWEIQLPGDGERVADSAERIDVDSFQARVTRVVAQV